MISRRDFLRRLGIGAGALAAAPLLPPIAPRTRVSAALELTEYEGSGGFYTSDLYQFVAGADIPSGQLVFTTPNGALLPVLLSQDKGRTIGIAMNAAVKGDPVLVMAHGGFGIGAVK